MSMREGMLTTPTTHINLHYRIWEEEPPPERSILLVHGLASTLRIWDLVAPRLTGKFRVAAYDQRGHAGSHKPDTGYDLDTELADLWGVIEALQLERPVVVGHSWGASLALAYAARHPDECNGVALVDGGVFDLAGRPGATWESVSRDLAPPDLSTRTLEDLVSWARGGRLGDLPDDFRYDYFRSMMEEQPDGTIRARLSRDNHMKILRTMWDTRTSDLLRDAGCPVLIIMAQPEEPRPGSREEQFFQAKQRGVAEAKERLREAKVVWMEDTIHDIPLHRPDRLADELLSFFA